MNKLVVTLMLASVVASPAFAKKRHPVISPEAAAAQASVPAGQEWNATDPNDVVVGGEVVGRDPDPAIRLNLMRNFQPGGGSDGASGGGPS